MIPRTLIAFALSFSLPSTSLPSTAQVAQAQASPVVVQAGVVLPEDDGRALVRDLNGFLALAQGANDANRYVLPGERLETYLLLNEMKGVEERAGKKRVAEKSGESVDAPAYRPYLLNVRSLDKDRFQVQVSYIGVKDGVPEVRASFNFVAHNAGEGFLFSSPLVTKTAGWKVEKLGNNSFHYQHAINTGRVQQYTALASRFDAKLKLRDKVTEFYCFAGFDDVLRRIGVDYKAEHNGRARGVRSVVVGDRKLVVLGNDNARFDHFDPHDLWHARLSLVVARSKVNQPIDEGCAYLYGGCWGETWERILEVFHEEIASDRSTDWLACKRVSKAFGEGYPRKFYVDHIANALLVKRLEETKGFAAVWEFLNCSPRAKGNARYFKSLEKLTGITRATYNERIWQLVDASKLR